MELGEVVAGETAIKLMHKEKGFVVDIRFRQENVYLWTKLDMAHRTIRCGGWHCW
jgi:hypothetical protein